MANRPSAAFLLTILLLPVSVLPFAIPPLLSPSQRRSAASIRLSVRPTASLGPDPRAPDPQEGHVGRRALFWQHLVPTVVTGLALAPGAAGAEARVGAVSWPAAAGALKRGYPVQDGPADSSNAAAAAAAGAERVRAGVREMCAADVKLCATILRVAFHDAISRSSSAQEILSVNKSC